VLPWKDTCEMSERIRFIEAWLVGGESISTLCRVSGISRKTGYKWMARYHEEGLGGENGAGASRRGCHGEEEVDYQV